ncbi:MAG: HD-GYP domain-containing protein [Actinomycetota bacterium]
MLMERDLATATPAPPRIRQTLRLVPARPEAWAALRDHLETIAAHDPYTAAHSRRVAATATHLARLMGMDGAAVEIIRQASLVHDLGKIRVPTTILNKAERPTGDELDLIRSHSMHGGMILEGTPGLERLAPIVYHHHEHWDGSGYPSGLSETKIPLESRIILVADAFDAMTSSRPYQPGIGPAEALTEIDRCAGQQFDPRVACIMQLAAEEPHLRLMEAGAEPSAVR